MDRRKILTGIGTVGLTAVAGCSSSDNGSTESVNDANGTNDSQQSESSTQNIEPSEPWQEELDKCSNSSAKIGVRDIKIDAEDSGTFSDGKVLVAIENLDIYTLNIVDVSVTYTPNDYDENQTVYWNERSDDIEDETGPDQSRNLDGEDLQSYTIDASYSSGGPFSREVLGIGSNGEVLNVEVYTADDPDSGGKLCWKPTES